MNLLQPCKELVLANMAPEETQALDILMHLVQPNLVVETGTWRGESAFNFSLHADVITVDDLSGNVQTDETLLRNRPITCLRGRSPADLPVLLDERVRGRRWIFLHDSEHYGDILLAEAAWAFDRGALCVLWHDYGMIDTVPGPRSKRPQMPDAASELRNMGHAVVRLMDCGNPEFRYYVGVEATFIKNAKGDATNWYTGIGLAWPR